MHSAKTVPQHHLMTLCQYKMFSLYQNTRKREKKSLSSIWELRDGYH